MSAVRQRPALTEGPLTNGAVADGPVVPRLIRPASALWAAGWLGRALHAAMLLALTLSLGVGAGLGLLAWRLGHGPLDVTGLARWAAARHRSNATLGRVTVAWAGFEQGAGRALHIEAADIQILAPPFEVRRAVADLSVAALLHGEMVPRTVTLQGVRGTVSLGSVSADSGSETPDAALRRILATLKQPARTDLADFGPTLLRQLRTVVLDDADLALDGGPGLGTGHVLGTARFVRTPEGGVVGTAQAHLTLGTARADATVTAALAETGTRLDLTLTPIDLAALSAAPTLARLGVLQSTVSGHIVLTLTPALTPRDMDVQVSAGAGRLVLQDVSAPFEAAMLAGTARWAAAAALPAEATVSQAQVVLKSPTGGSPVTLRLTGSATNNGGTGRGEGTLTVDHVLLADMPGLWPEKWGGHARPWLVQNITAGMAHDGHAHFVVETGQDGAHPKLVGLSAGLVGEDITVHWLRPAPPVEHVQASLAMSTPDLLEITASKGQEGALQLQNGQLRITGLSFKDQEMSIDAGVAGPVPALITLLKHPALHLLSDHPIPVQRPAGMLQGKLQITLPLDNDVQFEQVGIHASGRLSGLRLGAVVAGRDLEQGDIAIDVTQDGLHASGPATVAGIASQIGLTMDFTPGAATQIVQHATLAGQTTPRQLAAAGLDPGSAMPSGTALVTADYSEQRGGQALVALRADLREAALALPGWKKPPGAGATVSGRLTLMKGRLVEIDSLRAEGPGLRIEGRAELAGNEPVRLVLNPIEIGPTRARGEIELAPAPGMPTRLNLSGTVLDLSTIFSSKPGGSGAGGSGKAPGFIADVKFDRIILAHGNSFGLVQAHAEHDGSRLRALHLQTAGPERVLADVVPESAGRRVSLHAVDAGTLFRALDLTQTIVGGTLAIQARYDDRAAGMPLSGQADLTDFHVQDAPAVGKLLQALSVFGLPEAMSGPGLKLDRLSAPFVWNGDQLYLGESTATSTSLGLTAKGKIDVAQHTLDVAGTVVPFYAVNAALGRLPVIGRLFSPERGGGLFSLSYGLHGNLANPSVAVNPLSILTPGLARRLFRLFD